jgi:hypothetical protein
VGYAVKVFGKGVEPRYGIASAMLALAACAAGNVLAQLGTYSQEVAEPLVPLVWFFATHPAAVWELLVAAFVPADLFFYGFAAYYGYRSAFRRATNEEVQSVLVSRPMRQ